MVIMTTMMMVVLMMVMVMGMKEKYKLPVAF
jgi:hypothetical protein